MILFIYNLADIHNNLLSTFDYSGELTISKFLHVKNLKTMEMFNRNIHLQH